MAAENPRQIAVRVLQRHADGHGYVEELLEESLQKTPLKPVDRRLVQELTYGVVRWRATLDWLIARKTEGRTQKPLLQILLRLGFYQMLWLDRIPDHAIVNESVQLAKDFGLGPQAGFVNAVLRGYLRDQEETRRALDELNSSQPALVYSHPEWLCERWRRRLGDETLRQLLEWNNTPPITYARLNTLKTDAVQLAAQWEKEEVQFAPVQIDWANEGLVYELKSHPPLATLPSFRRGLFYAQDPSTVLAVQMLDPQPGESVFDLCAAPGGKTTYLAQRIGNRGRIVAHDPQPGRLRLLRENCERLGVTCVDFSGLTLLDFPESKITFDRVLVDVPCSNTGVLRRRVDLRWRVRPEEIQRLRIQQMKLLDNAAIQVKPGGVLVYSTCSLEPEENGEVVKEFLEVHSDIRLESERELLPFVEAMDGAYVARMTCQT